jgi:hypothetical protein
MSASAKDDASLGNVLIEMGVITERQLREAVERQENSSLEQLLGAVLVHQGYCSKEDVEAALSAQKSLRSGKRVKAALAVADIAIHRKASNGARDRAIISGARFVRSASSPEYVAVTAEMLAKSGGDR